MPLTDNAQVVTGETGLVDKNITLKKTFTKSDNGKSYQCHVQRADSTIENRDTAQMNVHCECCCEVTDLSHRDVNVDLGLVRGRMCSHYWPDILVCFETLWLVGD